MNATISKEKKDQLFSKLKEANTAFQQIYPGDRSDRQPVHTLYGGANLFKYDSAASLGKRALEIFETYAPDHKVFGQVFGMDIQSGFSDKVYKKVIAKLQSEAIEDFRIDFEDGYGNRSNEEEDETAVTAALEVARGMKEKCLPPFIGIRIKPFTEEMKERGLRTLDIFLSTLVNETGGKLPDNFIVMLPKVTIPEQPATLASFFDILETELKMEKGILKMEMMVETTQAIMDIDGINPLYRFIKAANGRCIAMHFGTYDYTASCSITAKYQEMDHPVCDFAHHMTKVALAHTGIWLSDGATNTMPIGPHRGDDLTAEQLKENIDTVHNAWKKGYDHIRHSLWNGFYQGWDLKPGTISHALCCCVCFLFRKL